MTTALSHTVVTAENIEIIKDAIPSDQAVELVVGCETWGFFYQGGQRGQMTIWPSEGRGAVSHGSDSVWGDWDGETLTTEEGVHFDSTGTADVSDAMIAQDQADMLRAIEAADRG